MEAGFDLCGVLRRIRRRADMSQRQLATATGLSASAVAHAEAGTRDLPVRALARAAVLAGLRLALLDAQGREVEPMSADTARDMGSRHFPAHLDTRHGDEGWWYDAHRYDRARPSYTFDRDRRMRDLYRQRDGTPDDHHVPQPGDSPWERAETLRREYWRQRIEERERRFLAGELRGIGLGFSCTCPAECEALDDYSGRPVHVEDCPCSCDVG